MTKFVFTFIRPVAERSLNRRSKLYHCILPEPALFTYNVTYTFKRRMLSEALSSWIRAGFVSGTWISQRTSTVMLQTATVKEGG